MWQHFNNSSSTRLILIRHGDVEDPNRAIGQTDMPLSEDGRDRIQHTSARLGEEQIDAIYSSDLSRSIESAEILATPRKLRVTEKQGLGEVNVGDWDGLPYKTIRDTYPDEIEQYMQDIANFRPPGGETLVELSSRVLPELRTLLKRHQGGAFCVVAHGLVNLLILCDAIGLDLTRLDVITQDYGCINRIDYFADGHAMVLNING